MGAIQRWKDRGLGPDRITAAEDTDFAGGKARQVYADYQERLRQLNAADFGDLMLHIVDILRTRPDVLAQYHRMFRYILVDEYQDTNTVQYLWLRLLAQREQAANICCVGDDDQSIYSWRGAEVENILRFEKDFPGATLVKLESNYRSTAPILAAASALIAHNEGRLGKTLRPGLATMPPARSCWWRRCGIPTRRRGWSASASRRCTATATRCRRWRSWCAPGSRPAPSRSG